MQFRVPHDHPSLAGHFPGHPVVPGVVVLDHEVAANELLAGPPRPVSMLQVRVPAT